VSLVAGIVKQLAPPDYMAPPNQLQFGNSPSPFPNLGGFAPPQFNIPDFTNFIPDFSNFGGLGDIGMDFGGCS
jgi:hypothetical protein